jgi:prepilin-type N-terminal cleavage/methylation domain-containing protein
MSCATQRRRGFTLVEMLVVIAILTVLLAVLMPSITRARFQAKVITCTSVLRNLGMAVTNYATAHLGRYPTAADPPPADQKSWDGTVWVRSWVWSNGSRYDLRPGYREYLGSTLDAGAKCPMASPYYQRTNLDNSHMSNYMLYMTNNHKTKLFTFEYDGQGIISSRMGHPWSPAGKPQYEFTYLASDCAFGNGLYGYGGAMTGHPALGGSEEHYSVINTHTGYKLGFRDDHISTSLNFVDGDASVHTFTVTTESYWDDDNWVTNGSYLLPKALAK